MDPSFWQVDLGRGIGPLVLGMERDAVIATLAETLIDIEPDDDDPTWLYVPEMETELTFSDGTPSRLVQLAVEDERVAFGSLPVIGKRATRSSSSCKSPRAKPCGVPAKIRP